MTMRNCIICGKEICRRGLNENVYIKRHKKRVGNFRGVNNITCGRKCAKTYERVYSHVKDVIRTRGKKKHGK